MTWVPPSNSYSRDCMIVHSVYLWSGPAGAEGSECLAALPQEQTLS